MKSNHLLLLGMLLLLPSIFSGQETQRKNNIIYNPFSRGMQFYPLQQNLGYSYLNHYDQNDVKQGHTNLLNLDLVWNYFFVNNWAIGVDLKGQWSGSHFTSEELNRMWVGNLNLTYGYHVSDRLNFYLQAGGGIGKEKNKLNSGGTRSTVSSDIYSYHATLGAPVYLDNHVFFTPSISYDHMENKNGDGKLTQDLFRLGLGFHTFLDRRDYSCDMSHGFAHSKSIYRQGNSFFGYYTQAGLGFGNSTTKYNNIAGKQKSNLTDGNINVDYNYYILDYLGLGAEVQYANSVIDPKNSNYKFTANSWNIMPMLTLNAPVKNGWNNTFLRLGAGFGQLKIIVDDAGTKTTQKDKLTSYGGWLGYNDFITDHLSLAPMIGYQWMTDKDNDTKVKVKARGIDLRLGIRYHL